MPSTRDSKESRRTRLFVREPEWYEDRARGLVSAHAAGLPNALAQIREWHPRFRNATDSEIRSARFDVAAARSVYARQHGFRSWPALVGRVEALANGHADEPFLGAFDALRRGDFDALAALVREQPDLLRARGTNGNSLLNLAASLAGSSCGALSSSWRSIFALLTGVGGDVDLANDRGWTPLHQAAYANRADLVALLLDAGADMRREAHGEGGTPLAVALFWGHREVSDLLAARGVVPSNLRVAAGLGRIDLIEENLAPDGTLDPKAGRGRGFYRPHSGFPVWQPSDDPREILDEALVWAAKSDRSAALALLVERGARVDADPYRGTPLLWAASCGRLEAAAWLLDHGADVDQRATFGGPGHGEGVTALHLAAQNGNLAMVRLLCDRGADPSIEDRIYRSSPQGWAEHFGRGPVLDYLRSHATARAEALSRELAEGRPARPSFSIASDRDAGAIAALRNAAADDLTLKHGSGRWSGQTTEKAVLRDLPASRVLVAREGDRIVGSLRLATKKPWAIDTGYFAQVLRPLYLLDMVVDPERQRLGLGRALLEEAKALARLWPADCLRLDAWDSPAGAGPFYAKCGFREVGRVTYRGAPLIYFEWLPSNTSPATAPAR